MPQWLLALVLKLLAEYLTPDVVKGLESELICIIEKALVGHPDAIVIVEALRKALGLPPCHAAAPAAAG